MSCIFTLTDDLDAEFPAVAARALGLDTVPLLCAREIPVPGSMPRVIRVLRALPRARPSTCPGTSTWAGRARCGPISARHNRHRWRSSSQQRIRRIPVYPVAAGLRPRHRGGDARVQRVLLRPAAGGGGCRGRDAARGQPLPRSVVLAAAPGARRALRPPAGPDRARQRLVRRAARRRRGAARTRRRGRLRLAGVQRLPASGGRLGRPRDRGPARRRGAPRPGRDARRDHGRHPPGARLQPEQPDLDLPAARRGRGVPAPRSRAMCA